MPSSSVPVRDLCGSHPVGHITAEELRRYLDRTEAGPLPPVVGRSHFGGDRGGATSEVNGPLMCLQGCPCLGLPRVLFRRGGGGAEGTRSSLLRMPYGGPYLRRINDLPTMLVVDA